MIGLERRSSIKGRNSHVGWATCCPCGRVLIGFVVESDMTDYRRARFCGGYYFFTVVTHRRRPFLADGLSRVCLRSHVGCATCCTRGLKQVITCWANPRGQKRNLPTLQAGHGQRIMDSCGEVFTGVTACIVVMRGSAKRLAANEKVRMGNKLPILHVSPSASPDCQARQMEGRVNPPRRSAGKLLCPVFSSYPAGNGITPGLVCLSRSRRDRSSGH